MFTSLFHKIQILSETVVYENNKEWKRFSSSVSNMQDICR